ncbi:MAG TPA: MFS transporter [Pseudolabrys sp.]
MNPSLQALNAVNFFMADVRDGLGPYLGVFLQQEKWTPTEIGVVMTIGGLAGMVATTPFGALVDRLQAKRVMMVVAALATVAASFVILFVPTFWATAVSQIATGVAGAVIPPAIAGITLGLVKQRGFTRQIGRNEAFNHAGNVAAALLCGALGYAFGLSAVFVVMSVLAVISLGALAYIDPKEIDYNAARGASAKSGAKIESFAVVFKSMPLIVLAATLLLFHLGNAAMLPLLGQSLAAKGADPSAYTSATIVIAQLTMIPAALLAAKLAELRGYWIVFMLALLALPLRGALAAALTGPITLGPVQILDGVGAGLLGVAVPGLVARILNGTGHVNAGLGAVMTAQGVGASLSPALGGLMAERLGYAASFLGLGGIAAFALALWVLARPVTAQACRGTTGEKHRRMTRAHRRTVEGKV